MEGTERGLTSVTPAKAGVQENHGEDGFLLSQE
jgi:hypothetical protein